jgi:transposase
VTTPTQLRESIIRAFHERRLSYEEIASLLGIGRATVSRVLRRHRETGAVAPRPRGGGNVSPIRGKVAERLVALVTRQPDLSVAELVAELQRRTRIRTSRSSVLRALHRLGYTRKKSGSWQSNATRQRTWSAGRRSPPS